MHNAKSSFLCFEEKKSKIRLTKLTRYTTIATWNGFHNIKEKSVKYMKKLV